MGTKVTTTKTTGTRNSEKSDLHYLDVVQNLVEDLDFGQVTIIVQDGRVIQVEQNRKIRLK